MKPIEIKTLLVNKIWRSTDEQLNRIIEFRFHDDEGYFARTLINVNPGPLIEQNPHDDKYQINDNDTLTMSLSRNPHVYSIENITKDELVLKPTLPTPTLTFKAFSVLHTPVNESMSTVDRYVKNGEEYEELFYVPNTSGDIIEQISFSLLPEKYDNQIVFRFHSNTSRVASIPIQSTTIDLNKTNLDIHDIKNITIEFKPTKEVNMKSNIVGSSVKIQFHFLDNTPGFIE